jgi:phytoene dehydrogenase-like protein
LAFRDGTLYTLPASPVSMIKSKLLSAGAKLEFGKLFATIGFIDAEAVNDMTLNDWIEAKIHHDDVKDAVRALVRVATYTNDPERMSAGLAIGQVQKAVKGVLYLDGGWQTLVDGLAARATSAGARIETNAAVTKIDHEGAAKIVHTNARTYTASTVIIATPPNVASELLGAAGAELLYKYEAAGPVRAATLDVGLSSVPNPGGRFVLGIDEPLYLSIHSGIAKLAPEGGASLHAAKYLGDDNSAAKHVERELEALLDLAQPGWRDVCVEKRFLPNLTVVNALATAEQGGLPGRTPVATDIEGVFLAGDWIGPEGWLVDGSLASAKAAAQAALDLPATERRPVAASVA